MSVATFLPRQARVLLFLASQVAMGTLALAQQPQNWDWCSGKENPTFEQRISACTAIVEAENETLAHRANALGNRAVAYSNNGNVDSAIRDYEESLRLDATSASSHRFRGNKYLIEKSFADALAEYNEAIRLDPTEPFAFSNRGRIYAAQAIADFDTAITTDTNNAWSLYGRGLAKWEKGYDSGAQADIIAAKKKRPDIIRAVAKYYGLTPQHSLLWRLFNADAKEYPMAFAIAHGDADACGAGSALLATRSSRPRGSASVSCSRPRAA
jgi:tetratricopeptide (TPR) repeat protein